MVRTRGAHPPDTDGRDRKKSPWGWVLAALAVLALLAVLFFWLFDVDAGLSGGDVDVDVPEANVDVEAPEVDAEGGDLPDVDVEGGELPDVDVDPENEADGTNPGDAGGS